MKTMANNVSNSRTNVERAVREMQKDLDKGIDAIRTELKELKEKGPEAEEAVERSLSDLKEGFEDRLSDIHDSFDNAREGFDDAVETGRSTIQERPLMAVGIALALGVVIGLTLGRRNSKD
jgi:ElaB/YqjD/DUF883 family membrane-anchored ribosome-binding protein